MTVNGLRLTVFSPFPRNYNKGFTLIELLISMAIMSVVIVIVSQAFWLGQRSWERGEAVLKDALAFRTLASILSRQFHSTFPLVTKDEAKDAVYHFSGDSESVRFVSSLPFGFQKQGGLFHVNYFIADAIDNNLKVLKVRQTPIYRDESFDDGEEEGISALTDLLEAEWSYLKEGEWRERWDGDEEEQAPEQVRLTLKRQEGKRIAVHELHFPIYVKHVDIGRRKRTAAPAGGQGGAEPEDENPA